MAQSKNRCTWCGSDPLYVDYHDKEWGVPSHNDKVLFEMLILEGAQAGLSWSTILKKRKNYKKAFDNWNFKKISDYNLNKEKKLLNDKGIIRNKLKIKSAIKNAKVFLNIRDEFGSFNKYIWNFTNRRVIDHKIKSWRNIPSKNEISIKISQDLKKRGMNFVGPTIIYAFLQSIGIINDHEISCFKH